MDLVRSSFNVSCPDVSPEMQIVFAARITNQVAMRSVIITVLVMGAMAFAPPVWADPTCPLGYDLCELYGVKGCCTDGSPRCCATPFSLSKHACTLPTNLCCPGKREDSSSGEDVCKLDTQRCCGTAPADPSQPRPVCCLATEGCCVTPTGENVCYDPKIKQCCNDKLCDKNDTCCQGGCFPRSASGVAAVCCGRGACSNGLECCAGNRCRPECCPPGSCPPTKPVCCHGSCCGEGELCCTGGCCSLPTPKLKWTRLGFGFHDYQVVRAAAGAAAVAAELLQTKNSPDQLFTEVARPIVPVLPQQPISDRSVPQTRLDLINSVLSNVQKATGLMIAIRVSLNRVQGAAMAQDKGSQSSQIQAAQRYGEDLSAVFEELSRQLKPFRNGVREADASCVMSRSDVAKMLSEVRSGRIPPDVATIWAQLGLEQPLLKQLEEKVLTDALRQWRGKPVRCDRLLVDAIEPFHRAAQDFARFAKSPSGEAPR